MAKALRGEAAIDVDGNSVILVIDVNVLIDIEDATGLGVTELGGALQEKPGFKLLRSIFHATMVPRQPDTTVAQAGDAMSAIGVDGIQVALQKLFTAAFPSSAEGKGKAATGRPDQAGTG